MGLVTLLCLEEVTQVPVTMERAGTTQEMPAARQPQGELAPPFPAAPEPYLTPQNEGCVSHTG